MTERGEIPTEERRPAKEPTLFQHSAQGWMMVVGWLICMAIMAAIIFAYALFQHLGSR